jgi:hypothetical protein
MSTCYGLNKPVWLTESGEHGRPGDDASLAEQANYVIKVNVRALSVGIRKIVWYALTTPNDDTEMQLLYDDWTPKPAFYAYKTLTREMRGYVYDHTLNITGVEGYAFRSRQQDEKIVAWGSGAITFTPASQLRVVDRNGNVAWIQDGGPGDLDDGVNNSIIYQVSNDDLHPK